MSLADRSAVGSHSTYKMLIVTLICIVYMSCSVQCHMYIVEVKSIANNSTFFNFEVNSHLATCSVGAYRSKMHFEISLVKNASRDQ